MKDTVRSSACRWNIHWTDSWEKKKLFDINLFYASDNWDEQYGDQIPRPKQMGVTDRLSSRVSSREGSATISMAKRATI
jgi:hypothetical protein